MNSYIAGIAIFLMVLSPLYIPIAVTVGPPVCSRVRRMTRAFGPVRQTLRRA
jgi:hypothetical protein